MNSENEPSEAEVEAAAQRIFMHQYDQGDREFGGWPSEVVQARHVAQARAALAAARRIQPADRDVVLEEVIKTLTSIGVTRLSLAAVCDTIRNLKDHK